jgi:hypothetical protein
MKKIPGASITRPDLSSASVATMETTDLDTLRTRILQARVRRRRIAIAVITFIAGVVVLAGYGSEQRDQVIAETPIRQFTVAELADHVRNARGHVLVLVLYNPESDDAFLVAALRRWATPRGRSRAELLALSVGSRRNAQAFFRYAGERNLPILAPFWLEPWRPGTLDSTMAELGVDVGKRWCIPLVAVIDSRGAVVTQWQGETDASPVIAAAEKALTR